ncbi:hypothetical protein BZA77DRAFT_324522 [Pyronema omphalodes]|nr:hypothetical protein BZA77DRAFT_324522 [Pyronema omphalodes]
MLPMSIIGNFIASMSMTVIIWSFVPFFPVNFRTSQMFSTFGSDADSRGILIHRILWTPLLTVSSGGAVRVSGENPPSAVMKVPETRMQ